MDTLGCMLFGSSSRNVYVLPLRLRIGVPGGRSLRRLSRYRQRRVQFLKLQRRRCNLLLRRICQTGSAAVVAARLQATRILKYLLQRHLQLILRGNRTLILGSALAR